eukprot:TRINITY_DN8250_c0_g1_i4.p2 TRINITY_DN8250_c0_g1~~TRINITY_DN8250_c0_g1_i4.p2  ORF type:complete len:346 (+),score=69.68 TRINITY_DN8250_c0_g1_i4:390-1427(+)
MPVRRGSLVAAAGEGSGKTDLLDADSLEQVGTIGSSGVVLALEVLPGRLLAVGTAGGRVVVADTASGAILQTWDSEQRGGVRSLCASEALGRLFVGLSSGAVAALRLAGLQAAQWLDDHQHNVDGLAVSCDHAVLASGSWDTRLVVRDTQSWEVVSRTTTPEAVTAAAFHPSRPRALLVGLRSGGVLEVDAAAGTVVRTLAPHTDFVASVQLDGAGERVLTSSSDGNVVIMGYESGAVQLRHALGDGSVSAARFSADQTRVHAVSFHSPLTTLSATGADPDAAAVVARRDMERHMYALVVIPDTPWAMLGPLRALCVEALRDHREVSLHRLPLHVRSEVEQAQRA